MSFYKSIVFIKGKAHCFHYEAHHASAGFQYFVYHGSAMTSHTSGVWRDNFLSQPVHFILFQVPLQQLRKLKTRKSKLKKQGRGPTGETKFSVKNGRKKPY